MVFEQESQGVLVRVEPTFLTEESDPEEFRFVWAYTVEIENRTEQTIQLINRQWSITDALGVRQEVRGQGVVGQQPVLRPGESFDYTSAAPLHAPSGVMVGSYEMERVETGERFFIDVPAFALESPHETRLAN